MRSSSDSTRRLTQLALSCIIIAGALSMSCSALPAESQSAATSQGAECAVAGTGISAQDTQAATALRDTVQRGPLYLSAAKSGVASCQIAHEPDEVTVEYKFRDGGWLRVAHQPKLEYTDQEVRFATPLGGDPVAVLTGAEQAAFPPRVAASIGARKRRNLQTTTRAHVRPSSVATCATARGACAAIRRDVSWDCCFAAPVDGSRRRVFGTIRFPTSVTRSRRRTPIAWPPRRESSGCLHLTSPPAVSSSSGAQAAATSSRWHSIFLAANSSVSISHAIRWTRDSEPSTRLICATSGSNMHPSSMSTTRGVRSTTSSATACSRGSPSGTGQTPHDRGEKPLS